MPRMYCSHIGLLYYPSTFHISPLVSFYVVLAARGGDVYEPSYFRMFLAAKRNSRWILPENPRLPRNIQASFTCRKSPTWYRRIYFPSEGRRAEDFFSPWKIQRLRSDLNPRTCIPKASTLPLDHRSRFRRNFVFLRDFFRGRVRKNPSVSPLRRFNGRKTRRSCSCAAEMQLAFHQTVCLPSALKWLRSQQ